MDRLDVILGQNVAAAIVPKLDQLRLLFRHHSIKGLDEQLEAVPTLKFLHTSSR